MKKPIIIFALAMAVFAAGACNQLAKKTESKQAAKKKGKYYCTMHPEITSDKPGICSKCDMEMVERDTTEK